MNKQNASFSKATFSYREALIIRMAAEGFVDREICDRLQIAPGTLSTYWSRIRHKAGRAPRPAITSRFTLLESQDTVHAIVAHVAEKRTKYNGREASAGDLRQTLEEAFQNLPVLAFVLDRDATIVAATRLLAAKWGEDWTPGKKVEPDLVEGEVNKILETAVIASGDPAPFRMRVNDGWYEILMSPTSTNDALWVGTARPAWPPGNPDVAVVEMD